MPVSNIVINAHLGAVIVTTHARERWAERGQEEPLEDSLKRALPFGGQFGGDTLLADGDVVFATKQGEFGRVVKTVLTKDQAIVNMEVKHGHRPHSSKPEMKPLPTLAAMPLRKSQVVPQRPKSTDDVGPTLIAMHQWSDDVLIRELEWCSGVLMQQFQRELGRRRREQKQIAHRDHMDREVLTLKMAIRELFTEEQVQQVWQRVAELRELAEKQP